MEETFTLKMSSEDRFLLDRLSEIEGESKSTVIRNALRKQGREYQIWPVLDSTTDPPSHPCADSMAAGEKE
ncbi:MAG: hypothetical protein KF753_18360 [Caldilineaceae bacterium]|nr:hypothetical protein [Caldilineaceae bacterium]